jgi:hypothetical protein
MAITRNRKPRTARRTRKPKSLIQYLVDAQGRRTSVVLPIEDFEELVEALEQREDVRYLKAAKDDPAADIPLEEFLAQLRAAGLLH